MKARDEWLCGYAAALGAVQRLFNEPSIVHGVLVGDGLTLAHLREARVESFDLRQLEKACKGRPLGGTHLKPADPWRCPVHGRDTGRHGDEPDAFCRRRNGKTGRLCDRPLVRVKAR